MERPFLVSYPGQGHRTTRLVRMAVREALQGESVVYGLLSPREAEEALAKTGPVVHREGVGGKVLSRVAGRGESSRRLVCPLEKKTFPVEALMDRCLRADCWPLCSYTPYLGGMRGHQLVFTGFDCLALNLLRETSREGYLRSPWSRLWLEDPFLLYLKLVKYASGEERAKEAWTKAIFSLAGVGATPLGALAVEALEESWNISVTEAPLGEREVFVEALFGEDVCIPDGAGVVVAPVEFLEKAQAFIEGKGRDCSRFLSPEKVWICFPEEAFSSGKQRFPWIFFYGLPFLAPRPVKGELGIWEARVLVYDLALRLLDTRGGRVRGKVMLVSKEQKLVEKVLFWGGKVGDNSHWFCPSGRGSVFMGG